jgi:acetyltransferase-like isoleucine patch superfamily enzyme
VIKDILAKRRFDIDSDRLGPDCPFTHWKLYFKSSMRKLCKSKFKYFDDSSEFRTGAYAIVCSKITINKNVIIRPNTMLFAFPDSTDNGSIIIENNVMIGSGTHVYTSNHRFSDRNEPIIKQGHYFPKSVVFKEGCWVGANVIILPGVTIGKNAVVGAGSVVTKDVPNNVVVVGNPAKVIKEII